MIPAGPETPVNIPGSTQNFLTTAPSEAVSPNPNFSEAPKSTPTIVAKPTVSGDGDVDDLLLKLSSTFGDGSGKYTYAQVRSIASAYHMAKRPSKSSESKMSWLFVLALMVVVALSVLGSTYLAEWAIENGDDASLQAVDSPKSLQTLNEVGPVLTSPGGSRGLSEADASASPE